MMHLKTLSLYDLFEYFGERVSPEDLTHKLEEIVSTAQEEGCDVQIVDRDGHPLFGLVSSGKLRILDRVYQRETKASSSLPGVARDNRAPASKLFPKNKLQTM